jgi:hypothetical protein
MPIGLLRGAATRALGLGARTVDDVLNPVLRNARIKAGNILQQITLSGAQLPLWLPSL